MVARWIIVVLLVLIWLAQGRTNALLNAIASEISQLEKVTRYSI